MSSADSPRVLHFNDCANVGQSLVRAARQQGWDWDYLPPALVRPQVNPGSGLSRLAWTPYFFRRWSHLRRTDVVHVHYATSVPLIHQSPLPQRPYFLHLHGSDIRRRWKEAPYHDQVQRAIDEAQAVFYTNLDTIEEATTARGDAEYMPAFVQTEFLPKWQLEHNAPKIIFTSRWDDDKGIAEQLQFVSELRRAFPQIPLEGLDWGYGAAAAKSLGVKLQPKMKHADYLQWLAGGTLAIGQANRILAVSEFEAMAIGLPLAALGSRIPRPDDGSTPPVIEGDMETVMAGIAQALPDPPAMAAALGGKDWVYSHHQASPYAVRLEKLYRGAI